MTPPPHTHTHPPTSTVLQFASCKEELLRLLDDYIKILGPKTQPYALEIKVSLQKPYSV